MPASRAISDDYGLNVVSGAGGGQLFDGRCLRALFIALFAIDRMVDRDQPQDGPGSGLHLGNILPVGGCTSNLGASRDERHLMLVFHDRVTWSRGGIIPPSDRARTPHLGKAAANTREFQKKSDRERRISLTAPVRRGDAGSGRGFVVLVADAILTRMPGPKPTQAGRICCLGEAGACRSEAAATPVAHPGAVLKAARMAARIFLFLGGDSYPLDEHIEHALGRRLVGQGVLFLGQRDICGAGFGFEERKSALLRMSEHFVGHQVVAIGRSSGGRIATLIAGEGARLSAIVALGYPFRLPGCNEDPRRVRHLASLQAPLLILQGEGDGYGTRAQAIERYQLSATVRIEALDTDHEMHLSQQEWDVVAARIVRHADEQRRVARLWRKMSGFLNRSFPYRGITAKPE